MAQPMHSVAAGRRHDLVGSCGITLGALVSFSKKITFWFVVMVVLWALSLLLIIPNSSRSSPSFVHGGD